MVDVRATVATVGLATGILLAGAGSALAAEASFDGSAIHCPGGQTIHWEAGRAAPSAGEERMECSLMPRTAGAAASADNRLVTSPPELEGISGRTLTELDRQVAYEKKGAEAAEHQHLLAGKFGKWAQVSTAWKEGRGDIYWPILGKWGGGFLVACAALFLLFGRKK